MAKSRKDRMKEDVMKWHREGADSYTIGELVGRSPCTVKRWLRGWGLIPNRRASDVLNRRRAIAKEMIESGHSRLQVCHHFADVATIWTVRRWIDS